MKRIYLIILLSAMTLSSMAQSVGEVFYIYRNDGQFNAFYCDDVQSIEYSYDGIDGVKYSEIVTQVVKTKDEVYKIPLASIDSVAFKVNDIVVSKDYQFVDEDGYDIISADIDNGQYVLRFHGDVPAIEEGKVMTIIGDDIAEIVRVQSIEVLGKDVTLLTEPASLGEVFANGSFTLSTEDGNNTNRASAVGHNIFYPTEIIMYDENNQRYNFKRSSTNRVSFEKNIYKFKMDYTGYEFYKNDYVRLYWEKYVAEFNLDLVLSFNFNSLREGKDKWRKGKLEMQKGVIRGTLTNDCMLRFDANAKKEEELEEIMLKRNIHKPIIAKFVVAGVPVVVIMNTHLYGHGYYNAEGSFSAYTGFATSTTAEIGYSWSQASGIKPYSTFNPSLTFHHPTIEGKAHLDYKAGVYPSITFSLYGLVGPTFNIKPYLRNTLDIGLYDDLISNDTGDYYGATFNQLVGYDASVGMSYLSPLGRDPFVLSPSWNVIEKVLYESPYKIKFKKASSERIQYGKPVEVSFNVSDYSHLFSQECPTIFPLVVKFRTNSGSVNHTFAIVNIDTGIATVTWTPSGDLSSGDSPFLVAMIHDHNGQVIATDRWEPMVDETSNLCPDDNHPHLIDLGLPSGTKWACCNIGASTPTGKGGYYGWGDTSVKSYYWWDTLTYFIRWNGDNCVFNNIGSDIAGSSYDVAHTSWGGDWRMPSLDMIKELVENCKYQKETSGFRLIGSNGNSIFIPFGGIITGNTYFFENEAWLWSSTNAQHDIYYDAYILRSAEDGLSANYSETSYYAGCNVRAVQSGISVITGEATNVQSTSATLNGLVKNANKANGSVSYAFMLSTSKDVQSGSDCRTIVGTCDGNGNLVAEVTNLTENTVYYYAAAYKIGEEDFILGEVKSFKAQMKVVTIDNPTVTTCSAILQGFCSKGVNYGRFMIRKEGDEEPIEYTANVDENGNFSTLVRGLEPETKYYYYAFVNISEIIKGNECTFTTQPIQLCPNDHHPHMIDLGLPSGTKWACCNIGATAPEGYGGYYAWGETEEKSIYSLEEYQHQINYTYHENGTVTADYIDLGNISGTNHDVTTKKWGAPWHMPSREHYDELFTCSDVDYYTSNGVEGWVFKSIYGGCVFFPNAGYRHSNDGPYYKSEPSALYKAGEWGRYWCSNLNPDNLSQGWNLQLDKQYLSASIFYGGRSFGYTVRAVK